MRTPSRALIAYFAFVLLLAAALFFGAKAWDDGGKSEKKLKDRMEAHETGIPLKLFLNVYGPKAMRINSGLCLLLLAAGPWATRRLQGRALALTNSGPRRVTYAVTAASMVLAAIWISPRLNHSLWADEMTSMWKFTVGEYNRDESGQMKFKPVETSYRLFSLKTPNNHMLYNTMAGTLHDALAKQGTGPQDTYFQEWILRLPAFIAGIAGIAGLAWLASEMGYRRAGWLAVLLLPLHPWFVRYATEARGYSVVLALVPTMLAAALMAIRTGRWRWWLLFTLTQVVMIDSWPLSADVVIVSNLVIFGIIFTSHWRGQDRWTQWFRWGVVSILGAMLTVQLLLPTLPQIFEYLRSQGKIDPLPKVHDAVFALFTGSDYHSGDPLNPYLFAWQRNLAEHPISSVLFLTVVGVLYLAGLVRLWRGDATSRWMAILTVGLPLGILVDLMIKHSIFLTWYWVPALPLTLISISVGFVALFEQRRFIWIVGAPVVLAVVGIVFIPEHLVLRSVPVQKNREAALLTRSVLNPTHPDFGKESITANVSMFYKGYDCDDIGLASVADMNEVIAKAKAAKLPLYINLSRPGLMQDKAPDLLKMLDDPSLFKKVETFYGTDEESTKWVYLYQPAGQR